MQLDPTLDIDKLGLKPAAKIIARALQEYGAYVSDASGSLTFYSESSPEAQVYWGGDVLRSEDIAGIPLERLRVLELGALTQFR